ncbi:metallopeptidase family protein [Acidipropionibacterium timonense]|uniref:metallopeptidase family protein n=1 Tax=Acidipropionibacterium timonense TaxID=2161818 RepID=UPI001030E06D|nr:metallopeptidase family protein [Acidipropionibacterium timonense]
MTEQAFDRAIDDALDRIPPRLRALLDDVVIQIAEEPPADEPADLLGLYDGVPLTDRDSTWGFVPPDVITIFAGPLRRAFPDHDELVDEIAVTVIHEVAHHFGIDDDRLTELGWD